MLDNQSSPAQQPHPWVMLILVLLTVLAGFTLIGPLIGLPFSLLFYEGGIMEMLSAMQDPINHPEIRTPLFIFQGFATLIGLIIGPALLLMVFKTSIFDFFELPETRLIPIGITVTVVIVFMITNSFFIEWNSSVTFPEALKGFETWAKEKEEMAAEITRFMTRFESFGDVLVAILVIAVLPAIGEELVFRGLIQNELLRATRNPHVAIWIAAILFSGIHMQFFGFVPRLWLGAMFGYLYLWSGKLSIAILAHFINNAFSVVAMYLYQQKVFDLDVESSESAPLEAVFFSAFLTVVLLYAFRMYYIKRPAIPEQQ